MEEGGASGRGSARGGGVYGGGAPGRGVVRGRGRLVRGGRHVRRRSASRPLRSEGLCKGLRRVGTSVAFLLSFELLEDLVKFSEVRWYHAKGQVQAKYHRPTASWLCQTGLRACRAIYDSLRNRGRGFRT